MEFNILYGLQSLRGGFLDNVMVTVFNTLVGSKGEIWAVLGALLLIFRKTRKAGLCVLLSYAVAYGIGDVLKNIIARPRPCAIDETVALIISRPSSFSCPSVHTMLAFASAASLFLCHKKTGIAVLVFAALVGFSRMYFFVHFPTDVLLGAVLGFGVGVGVFYAVSAIGKKIGQKKTHA